jgi:hypothetical protein
MSKKKTPTTPKRPAKHQASAGYPEAIYSQFWVIDTDTPGMSEGQFSASGPYPTQAAAEAAIIADIRDLWEDSCTCLTSDKKKKWCKPLHIVEVRRTVEPEITPTIRLIDTENAKAQLPPRSSSQNKQDASGG